MEVESKQEREKLETSLLGENPMDIHVASHYNSLVQDQYTKIWPKRRESTQFLPTKHSNCSSQKRSSEAASTVCKALDSQAENQDLLGQVREVNQQSAELQTQTTLIAELMTAEQRLKAENEQSVERFRSLQVQMQEMKANHRISQPGKEITTLQFVHRTQMAAADTEKQSLRAKLADLKEYVEERSAFVAKIEALKEDLEREKRKHKQELWEMNAAQIRATSRLRKEIQSQLEQTKIALLKMNDQQLEASTRMTAEENQKLVSEVEFLSKETEKLLEKNTNLEQELGKMRKYAEAQRQIETELVKRSKLCEKLLAEMGKRLNGFETAPDSHQSSVVKYDPDLVSYLEKKVEELTSKLETLERKNTLLRREKQAQMKATNNIIAVLGDFAANRSDSSEGLWRL